MPLADHDHTSKPGRPHAIGLQSERGGDLPGVPVYQPVHAGAIAHKLSITPRAVEIHRSYLMDKLDCRNLAQAARLALTAGFEV